MYQKVTFLYRCVIHVSSYQTHLPRTFMILDVQVVSEWLVQWRNETSTLQLGAVKAAGYEAGTFEATTIDK